MATVSLDGDEFEILCTGAFGQVQVVPSWPACAESGLPDGGAPRLPRHALPCGLPPLSPDINEGLAEYLLHPETLGIHDVEKVQRFVPHIVYLESLYSCDLCPVQSTIVVDRDSTTGQLIGYKEEYSQGAGRNVKTSLLMTRPLGPPTNDIRGAAKNYPFWPGGMDVADDLVDSVQPADFEGELLHTPPGFSKGMTFALTEVASEVLEDVDIVNLEDIYNTAFSLDSDSESDAESAVGDDLVEKLPASDSGLWSPAGAQKTDDVESLLQEKEPPILKISDAARIEEKVETEWAVQVDVNKPVLDFHERIPNMAYKWPFELDTFQKQAILRLESHDSVFVAAHTSAGKTVVAEYAIALSKRHMTRTIYTSPIKALSNQKFRDFKITFEDVGLITGDIQINQQASCLIMTTEILRSMLYGGSDIIRDLEWVVFDEVHYINDSERGVVWEEVLIMLPAHVNIILLSATVPNTMEFADWVGRTKKRKVYVISTLKRPVPLEHFLYTGNSGKTSNEMFLLVDADKNFLTQNYNKALLAKKERATKSSQQYGAKGQREGYGGYQDKNVWLSLIDMLSKKDKLPAVAFTFSKKRIDDNCYSLGSVDLTDSTEKSEIHVFFQKCLNRLKAPDRELPQVAFMQELLKRGLAIHHSGVLPILKEIVELLFQKGLIKLLFATETFAMGVNMPARTVIFDSLRKHDGINFRDLHPGEYIQMAGRAGRRGLDTTGTVIILCKGDVPEMSDLHKMLLGKPTQLESRFRLTYSMMLNLLRVDRLRVQDMLRRSFSEFATQKDTSKHEQTLASLKLKLSELKPLDCYYCSTDMETYYNLCQDYHQLRKHLLKSIVNHPLCVKVLSCGRVVVLRNRATRRCTLAVTLASSSAAKGADRTYTCLLLTDGSASEREWKEAFQPAASLHAGGVVPVAPVRDLSAIELTWLARPQSLAGSGGGLGAVVLDVSPADFTSITQRCLRLSGDRVLEDYKRRQMPKHRDEPVGQALFAAVQELRRVLEAATASVSSSSIVVASLPELEPVRDFGLHDVDTVDDFRRLHSWRERLRSLACLGCPDFDIHFDEVGQRLSLAAEFAHTQFLLSEESLRLLPEYEQRIAVLRRLRYVDATNTVQLKGRVAGYINQQEVLITELLFENVLSELHHTEIAALLSCVVFEQKNCSEPNLIPSLKKGKENILKVATQVGLVQKECGLQIPVQDYVDELHFGLVEVVFEWARGMPFADITRLTDIQEGIIVRCIQRLDETLRDVKTAAHVIGDPVLFQKMEEASKAIKRDIVFAASLYTQ